MGTKYRIAETEDGRFCPQFKPGWFQSWRGFSPDADKMRHPTLQIFVQELDPSQAATFTTAESAAEFVDRVKTAADTGWQARTDRKAREAQGIRAKRIIRL